MDAAPPSSPETPAHPPATGWRLRLRQSENLVAVACLGAMVLLPLTEAVLRKLFNVGIGPSATLTQYLWLILGMAGGALAARDQRLLSLSTLSAFLGDRAKDRARVVSHGFAAAITVVLCAAAWQFMLQERTAGNQVAYGIKRWMIEVAMPLGFGLIALRLLWNAVPPGKDAGSPRSSRPGSWRAASGLPSPPRNWYCPHSSRCSPPRCSAPPYSSHWAAPR